MRRLSSPLGLLKTAPVRPHGRLESALNAALDEVPARRHIQSILVKSRGELVVERYFRDRRPDDLSNLHSVTKSVLASLVGIAMSEGSSNWARSYPTSWTPSSCRRSGVLPLSTSLR